jgi:uncharacterized protein (DUF1697 family)
MKTFISILRGINVSGQKKILMADLKTLYESLGFRDVITYIQSGNVIFKSGGKGTDEELAKKVEKAIKKKYGFEVPVIIRSNEEIRKIISDSPFRKEKIPEIKKLHVVFLSEIPDKVHIEGISKMDFSPDRFHVTGKNIFLHIPDSYAETKLSNTFFEKKLKVTATTRNWNTVLKLSQLAD